LWLLSRDWQDQEEEEEMKYILLVDGSYLLHRILHAGGSKDSQAFQEMQTSSGIPTGGVFGVLKALRAALTHVSFQVGSVVVVWDGRPSGLSKRRLSIYPQYKQRGPAATPEEDLENQKFRHLYEDQRPRVEQLLKLLNVVSINLPGREGDDVVASMIPILQMVSNAPILVMSDDRDYYQLVSDRVHLYRAIKDVVITPQNFFELTNVSTPRKYLLYAALCGDSSDNITGIVGVGDVTARNLANNIELDENGRFTFTNIVKVVSQLMTSDKRLAKKYQLVVANISRVQRNLMLMDLSLETLDGSEGAMIAAEMHSKSLNDVEVARLFTSYEFRSLMENVTNLTMPFRSLW
jgi:DNA polymerase-1